MPPNLRLASGLALIAVPLACCTALADAVAAPKLALLCLAGAAAIPALLGGKRPEALGKLGGLQLALILLVVVSALTHPTPLAWTVLLPQTIGLLFYLLWRSQPESGWARQRVWIVAVALIVTAYSWVQRLGLDPLAWGNPHLSRELTIATLGNPDYLALYLATAAPLVWEGLVGVRSGWMAGLAGWVLLVLAAVLTTTRAAWLSLALSWMVLGAFYVWRDRLRFRRWLVSGVVLLLALGLVGQIQGRSSAKPGFRLVDRASNLLDESSQVRLLLWRGGLKLFAREPWLGCGPTGFSNGFLLFREGEPAALRPLQRVPENAHNQYIQTLAEEGALGLVLLLAQVVLVGYRLGRKAYGGSGVELLAAWLGLSLNLLFLCPDLPSLVLWFWLLTRAEAREDESAPTRWPARVPLLVTGLMAALALVLWAGQALISERVTWLADDDKILRIFDRARLRYQAALGLAPPWKKASAWENLGSCLLAQGLAEPRPDYPTVAAAGEAYAQAVQLTPQDPYAWANRARCLTVGLQASASLWPQTIASWQQALQRDPYNPVFRREVARLLYAVGQLAAAEQQVQASLSLDPLAPAAIQLKQDIAGALKKGEPPTLMP